MRNNQNEGWKWNGNLYNINEIQYLPVAWTLLVVTTDPDISDIFSGPKLEPVLPKQNRPNLDIRNLFSGFDNSLISGLHCT